jgi:3-deoxy-manno-octulosonate cytidylyltransferase (CMP-KDO synthetase)
MRIAVVIPARLQSTRFPNKLLAEFRGKSILQNVIDYTKKFNLAAEKMDIILATSDDKLIEIGKKNNLKIFETEGSCGTEKVYNVYKAYAKNYDYYISIPADEPYFNPKNLNEFEFPPVDDCQNIITFYCDFYNKYDLKSFLSCKVITNPYNQAVYFSRNIIPVAKDGSILPLNCYKKHIGIFIFSKMVFDLFGSKMWDNRKSFLAQAEGLEQNRFIEFEFPIWTCWFDHIGFGIDEEWQIPILESRIDQEVELTVLMRT